MKLRIIFLFIIFAAVAGPLTRFAYAAALTSLSDIMSTVKELTLSDHDIKFASPTGIAAGQTVIYTFNTYTTVASTTLLDADFAISSSSTCSSAGSYTEQTLAATASGATWGFATSSSAITITSGTATSTAGNCIRLRVGSGAVTGGAGTARITNPAASSPTITMTGTFNDTGTITANIIANDAVAVSGTVNQTLSFSISTSTIAFGTLDSAAARYASTTSTGSATEVEAHTLSASTNASSGYTITVQGATLTSGGFTITSIGATNASSTIGTEQFGIRMAASGGIGTVTSPYAAAGGFAYAATATTTSQIASSAGASAATTYSVRYIANILAITEAGSYTASLVYVATGNF